MVNFPLANGLFVTGTGTGVVKTLVTGTIAKLLRENGINVGVFKPVATGCSLRREGLVSADAEFLAHCSNSSCLLEQINPIRYRKSLAPFVAARLEHRPINYDQLKLGYQNVVDASDVVLVEGIGGVMVPLEIDYAVLDMMAEMALAVVIVADSKLGTINHTLLTVYACRQKGLRIAGIVINSYQPDDASLAQETNPRILAEITGLDILAIIPYDESTYMEKGTIGQPVLSAVGMANWWEIMGK